ncbi:MAG: nucleoside hydrolase [bacterium]
MERLIIDTDPAVGVPLRDIDDGLAIAIALCSPELDVIGITVTHGNVDQKRAYQSARRIIKAMGREDVPVIAGAKSRKDSANRRPTDASQFIANKQAVDPGDLSILALGPLSNLAAAERQAPGTLRAAKRIVAMGGAVDRPGNIPPLMIAEFNFWKDPHAAALVLREANDLTLIPFDLTSKVIFGWKELYRLRDSVFEFPRWLYRNTRAWHALNCLLMWRGGFCPHDPLAAAFLIHPEWYETETVALSVVESGVNAGQVVRDPAGTPVRVAFGVDSRKFLDFLLDSLIPC